MASDKPRCNCCADWYYLGREKVREARQNHGGGPECLPHRKAGTSKERAKKRSVDDHQHIYVTTTEFSDYVYTDHHGRPYVCTQTLCAEWTCRKFKPRLRWRDTRVYLD